MNSAQLFCLISLACVGLVFLGKAVVVSVKCLLNARKEPTYRIREWYGKDGSSWTEARLRYTPEVKTYWGWRPVNGASVDYAYAEWNLRQHIRRRAEANRKHEITHYNRDGERHG